MYFCPGKLLWKQATLPQFLSVLSSPVWVKSMEFCSNRVSGISFGQDFQSEDLQGYLQETYRVVRYRDAFQLILHSGEVWVFDYGVMVFWAVNEDERQALIHRLQPLTGSRQTRTTHEHLLFSLDADENGIRRDTISLTSDDPLSRLAISHALAQSMQLDVFEERAKQTIIDTSEIPAALSLKGKIPLKRKAIAMMRGQLFATKSDIILHYGLLDTPEFFWEYPEYEPLYSLAARYLEIRPRVELLSHKLETIHELLEMLADEQKHHHSSFLEWIIIILIAIEIVIFVVQEMGLL